MRYIVILLLLFKSDLSFACNCTELGLSQRFNDASEVFIARVTQTKEVVLASDDINPNDIKRIRASYDLIETFKGTPEVPGYILDTDISIDSCSLGISPGVEYIVFLYNSKQVVACGGTQDYTSTKDGGLVKKLRELKLESS